LKKARRKVLEMAMRKKTRRSLRWREVDEINGLISEFTEYGSILQRSLQRIPKNLSSE
jgi:hypothetical protein